ncbi:MAG TPA: hypothetical protein VM534_03770, partial [Thermoanaerobaculia bacterium]|nr:hypothetical protein [Thermoanaerobaculia bacterium]
WFARDPWQSRTFWRELFLVSAKAAVIVALFAAVLMTGVVVMRNVSMTLLQTAVVATTYFISSFAVVLTLLILTGVILKLRPELAIESPAGLMSFSMAVVTVVCLGIGAWWLGFDDAAAGYEPPVVLLLLFVLFVAGTVVVSAALLSFSIHEARRIPRIHRKPRTIPISAAGLILLVVLFVPSWLARPDETVETPLQIPVGQSSGRVAMIAIEGMTAELLEAHSQLGGLVSRHAGVPAMRAASSAALWASVGTGTPPELHRVRAIEGLQLAGSPRVLQSLSRWDFPLRRVAPALGITRRQPLPPSVRERDYVWEVVASRGISAVAINWWAAPSESTTNLRVVAQEEIFSRAAGEGEGTSAALAVDRLAMSAASSAAGRLEPRLVTVYLPALDILNNRLDLDEARRLPASIHALDQIIRFIGTLRERGYEVLLIGMPGQGQPGHGVIASTTPLDLDYAGGWSLAPTLLDLFGFPASEEMPGSSLLPGSRQLRLPSFGSRREKESAATGNDEYYESLRSLGYIQ